jgi:hypothetical protein
MYRLLPLLAFSFLLTSFTFSPSKVKTYELQEALDKGLVELQGIQYAGKGALEIKVKSLSKRKDFRLQFSPGLQFASQDTSAQDQLLIKGGSYLVRAGRTISPAFRTYCTQADHIGVGSGSTFELKSQANGQLLQLAKYLSSNRYLMDEAQHAVWVITDDHSLKGLYMDDKLRAAKLQRFVSELTGKPLPEYTVKYRPVRERQVAFNPEAIFIHGIHKYRLEADARLSCNIYNEQGKIVQKVFENMAQRRGYNKIDFTLKAYDLPSGKYVSRILDEAGEVIQEIWVEA